MQQYFRLRTVMVFGLCLLGACSNLAPPPGGVNPEAEYIIGPGDTLNVFVYRVPEFSAEVPVRPDGRVSTPLVPDVVALGKTPSQVAGEIQERLKKYVTDPLVTVMVTGFTGPLEQEIRVIGEVAQPTAVAYRAQMSVLDLMIVAKGLTRFAAGNRAVIVRRESDHMNTYGVRLDDLLKDGDISQNIALRPGDTLFVPQAWF
jgi:polysaccharide export outer membrane protein